MALPKHPQPWLRFTYGVMPTKTQVTSRVSPDGYHYSLRGRDSETFMHLDLDPGPVTVSPDELWGIMKKLHRAYDNKQDDAAGELLSSFLYSLDIEWI